MLGTVVEVADLALDAYELSHRRNKPVNPDHCTQLQETLDHERLENHRLRATLEEYETIIQHINALSKETPDSQMPHYESCPSDLYEQLVKTLESPTFLEKLQALRQNVMARIVVNNPKSKSLTPEQLQTTISRAFANMHRTNTIRKLWVAGKVIYTIASCGLTLYGLYTQRHIIKAATKVVVKSGKVIVKAL